MSEERDMMEARVPDNGGGISVAGMVIGIVAAVFTALGKEIGRPEVARLA
mgnify:CR=1 FL=1